MRSERRKGNRDNQSTEAEFVYVVGEEPAEPAEPEASRVPSRPVGTGPIVNLESLTRHYQTPAHTVEAIKGIDLSIERGQLVAVRGRSGSGKTTLLNLIGGLDRPTTGTVLIDGSDVTTMDESELVKLRREKIGFVFQAFGLIPILTAAENVEIPLRMMGARVNDRRDRVALLLDMVGLSDRIEHRPHELSGGEQQRVGIARALANNPPLLLADEPTGQLDSRTGRSVMNLVKQLVASEGVTAIVATHDPALIDLADRVVDLLDGQIAADTA